MSESAIDYNVFEHEPTNYEEVLRASNVMRLMVLNPSIEEGEIKKAFDFLGKPNTKVVATNDGLWYYTGDTLSETVKMSMSSLGSGQSAEFDQYGFHLTSPQRSSTVRASGGGGSFSGGGAGRR